MSTYLLKQLRVGCVCFGGEIDVAGADALMALAADEIERLELCEKTSAEQLQSHSERLAEAGRREASLQELTRKLRKCLRAQTYQTSITAKSINNAVNEKLAWHNVVPGGLTLKEHPCEQNVGTCVNHLLDTIADLREATTSWACPYCGEATRDRSSAMLHPAMCEKWPYRLEVERLRAIVGKLPKCWRLDRNGALVRDVPITPGMLVYSIYGYRGIEKRVADGVWYRDGRWLLRTDNITFFCPEDCGDTLNAAEALLKQERSENTERES